MEGHHQRCPFFQLKKQMANIIIRKPGFFGRSRSEQEENLRKEGMASLTDEQLDKCKYLERKVEESVGAKKTYLKQYNIDKVK